jgi:hypothetical protein
MAKPTTKPKTLADALWSIVIGALAATIVLLRTQNLPWWAYGGFGVAVAVGAYVKDW